MRQLLEIVFGTALIALVWVAVFEAVDFQAGGAICCCYGRGR